MLFDVISPIVFAVTLLPVGSPLDAVLTHRPQQKVAVRLPYPHFVQLIEGDGSNLLDESGITEADTTKCQHAGIISRRNELVRDRDAGSVWPALASSFLLGSQPCQL